MVTGSSYTISTIVKYFGECPQVVGCSEKLKNSKLNIGYSYFIALWYIETEKARFFFYFEFFLAWGVASSKFLKPLYK